MKPYTGLTKLYNCQFLLYHKLLIFYSTPRRRLFAPTPLTNFWRSPIIYYW
ncbi:hypothetical protein NIES39_D02810 [Arthrospira platensis NIES-39]|nr:hypothetical protein NIES39_D02810 [Arthrospira platensis NIES-39]